MSDLLSMNVTRTGSLSTCSEQKVPFQKDEARTGSMTFDAKPAQPNNTAKLTFDREKLKKEAIKI